MLEPKKSLVRKLVAVRGTIVLDCESCVAIASVLQRLLARVLMTSPDRPDRADGPAWFRANLVAAPLYINIHIQYKGFKNITMRK